MTAEKTAEILELVTWLKEQADSQEGGPSSNLNKAAVLITSLHTRLEVAEMELAQLRSSIRDTMESLGDENDAMTGDLYIDFVTFQGEAKRELVQLKQANAELVKDRERLNWLERRENLHDFVTWLFDPKGLDDYEVRQAIDAAITKGTQ